MIALLMNRSNTVSQICHCPSISLNFSFVGFRVSFLSVPFDLGNGRLEQAPKPNQPNTHNTMSHHASYTFGGLLSIGGIFAFAKKKSVPSLGT